MAEILTFFCVSTLDNRVVAENKSNRAHSFLRYPNSCNYWITAP
jgi:hypothetical protein